MNELAGNESALVIDRMVLALIPDLDTSVADPDQQLPDAAYIVHTYDIPTDYKGYVAPDQVVYSMILGTDVGDFSFNWIGMLEAVTDTVISVTVTPESSKWATDLATNTTGNNITRNVILSYQDAKNLTGITVAAETWQFDYQAELNAHRELVVDPTSNDATVLKHLYNNQAKVWEDHVNAGYASQPHGLTAAVILSLLKTVDGDGSGLSADSIGEIDNADVWHNGNQVFAAAGNGYLKLKNGLMMQWGSQLFVHDSSDLTELAYPVTFPNAALFITGVDHEAGCHSIGIKPLTKSTFGVSSREPGTGSWQLATTVSWLAIGY